MNKDIIVLLLQKDINELSLLTDGFEQMEEFPEPILRLAREKATSVLDRIKDLSSFTDEEQKVSLGAEDIIKEVFTETEDRPEYYEKNNFDVPLDSYLESQLGPHETGCQETDTVGKFVQETGNSVEKEFDTDNAASDEEADYEEIEHQEEFEEAVESTVKGAIISEAALIEEIVGEDAEAVVDDNPQPIKTVLKDKLSLEDKSLTNNLENQKIEDIRHAINIGDRFRFQRELFGGNGELLNKTINYLNQLAKFSEAESFLKSKFGWADDNVHAEDFLQIVKRRYL